MSLPLVMGVSGPQPQSLVSLNQQIIDIATQLSPGLTTALPGSMIEDIASTDTAALALIDQAQVDLINSVTPYGANLFILNLLGQIYGVQQGVSTNTSVYVIFAGTPGFLIPTGLIVSDGTYQYLVQENSVIDASGYSQSVYCVATVSGTWAVPANTVTHVASAVPSAVGLTVTNPEPGTPSSGTETTDTYRARVLQAGLVTCAGTTEMVKYYLGQVNGVNPNLISVTYNSYYSKWEVIVAGGDPYAVANAIFLGCGDPNAICGSALQILNVTNANPGVITTNLYHGYSANQLIHISGATGMTAINGDFYVNTVLSNTTFTISATSGGTAIDTTSYPTYINGGLITPNFRNQVVSINSVPDLYQIPFVVPVQQTILVTVTWNTYAVNLVANSTIQALGAPAIVNYINDLSIGQPVNLLELQSVTAAAISPLAPTEQLSKLNFTVTIDGSIVSPLSGTTTIYGDQEGYFFMDTTQVTFTRG